MVSPLARVSYRSDCSPPSPVFDFPPIRFIAIARLVCASYEIDPKDIAPVTNRFTISFAGSTSPIEISWFSNLNLKRPRKFFSLRDWSFISAAYWS